MKRLSIFYTPSYASISVQNGVDKGVSGTDITKVIQNLDVDSLGVLVAFCRAVCKMVDEPNSPSMFITK